MEGLELHEAASTGDYDTLHDLLRSGKVDPNLQDEEWKNRTALHWAAAKGFVECMRLLLEHGAQGEVRMDMDWTPAHCAAEAGKLAALRALHAANVPVNRPDKYGDTPRRLAQVYGHTDCVKYLQQVEQEIAERQNKTSRSDLQQAGQQAEGGEGSEGGEGVEDGEDDEDDAGGEGGEGGKRPDQGSHGTRTKLIKAKATSKHAAIK